MREQDDIESPKGSPESPLLHRFLSEHIHLHTKMSEAEVLLTNLQEGVVCECVCAVPMYQCVLFAALSL